MSTEPWPAGHDLIRLAETDSTMAEAARRASGLTRATWILALRQTAARGRRGRAWTMPEGNFAATLVLPFASDPAKAALRSFVAALALHDACVAVTGRAEPFALKWPNDVLLNGGKLAGILLERPGPGAPLLIGIGVNLAAAPAAEALERGALAPVALAETGARIGPDAFLGRLAPAVARWEARLTAEGFGPVRAAWLARAARLGQPIVARMAEREEHGLFETVDDSGRLVLQTAGGRQAIAAADVHFG